MNTFLILEILHYSKKGREKERNGEDGWKNIPETSMLEQNSWVKISPFFSAFQVFSSEPIIILKFLTKTYWTIVKDQAWWTGVFSISGSFHTTASLHIPKPWYTSKRTAAQASAGPAAGSWTSILWDVSFLPSPFTCTTVTPTVNSNPARCLQGSRGKLRVLLNH